jgi:hypothetical protein
MSEAAKCIYYCMNTAILRDAKMEFYQARSSENKAHQIIIVYNIEARLGDPMVDWVVLFWRPCYILLSAVNESVIIW